MGLRGPSPEPTTLRLLKGNPGHRPLNQREPQPRAIAPVCPQHIKADLVAFHEWRRIVGLLRRMHLLTEADGTVIAALCIVHSSLLLNLGKMRELNAGSNSGLAGVVIATKTGYLAANQIYLNVQSCIEQELKLCRELGLSPSSRTKLQTTGAKRENKDPWANL